MFKSYKGRIIATFFFIIVIVLWDIIFYGFNNYSYNLLLDLTFTITIGIIVWWLASYYDRSTSLLCDLTQSETRYKELIDTTSYVIDNLNQVVYQIDKDRNFVLINPAWESLTGFTIEESLGRSIDSFIYPEDQEYATNRRISNTIQLKKETAREEFRFRKKDGGFIWLRVDSKIYYDDNSHVVAIIGTLTDITDWKLSEKGLLQLNENLAIQSDKLGVIAQMSAAIAHEVRNPLTAISGFLQLIKERKEFKEEYVEIIFDEMKRIEFVLNEMLLLSKPQTVAFTKVNISQILQHVLTLVRPDANMKSIKIEVCSTFEEPIWVYGEGNQLKQVFINLLKNSIEAMDDGGKIYLYHASDQNNISIYVKDEGVGIPQETLETIGQPFYTTKEKGTGLGLTVCFKIIENHKGKIHISSELGVGTTFEILLPHYIEIEKNSTDKAIV
ncbi:ATP-binding protein [Fredinandcohnia sp. 179-A 10B2 NHS]|uniref:ATP-binding protein n=1 Tax=Fredinandcohnia sp. 179-A 10B2 NHS TaxID=3235176 RepID=UPI0039A073F9